MVYTKIYQCFTDPWLACSEARQGRVEQWETIMSQGRIHWRGTRNMILSSILEEVLSAKSGWRETGLPFLCLLTSRTALQRETMKILARTLVLPLLPLWRTSSLVQMRLCVGFEQESWDLKGFDIVCMSSHSSMDLIGSSSFKNIRSPSWLDTYFIGMTCKKLLLCLLYIDYWNRAACVTLCTSVTRRLNMLLAFRMTIGAGRRMSRWPSNLYQEAKITSTKTCSGKSGRLPSSPCRSFCSTMWWHLAVSIQLGGQNSYCMEIVIDWLREGHCNCVFISCMRIRT